MSARLLVAGVLLTVAGLTTACAPAPLVSTLESADAGEVAVDPGDPAPSKLEIPAELIAQAEELGQPDAAWYAVEYGVSVEEAVARLDAQLSIGAAESGIAEALGTSYAGLWIEHEPRYRVVIASTEPVASERGKELTAGIDAPIAWEVAKHSLADLEAVRAQVDPAVQRLDGVMAGTSIDVRRNALVVEVLDPDPVTRLLAELGVEDGSVLVDVTTEDMIPSPE